MVQLLDIFIKREIMKALKIKIQKRKVKKIKSLDQSLISLGLHLK